MLTQEHAERIAEGLPISGVFVEPGVGTLSNGMTFVLRVTFRPEPRQPGRQHGYVWLHEDMDDERAIAAVRDEIEYMLEPTKGRIAEGVIA